MSTRLCALCNRFLSDWRPGKASSPHHSSPSKFLQVADEGCYICRSITNSYQWRDISSLCSEGFPFDFTVSLETYYYKGSRLTLQVKATCLIVDSPKLRQAIEDLDEIREKLLPKLRSTLSLGSISFSFYFHLRSVTNGKL